MDGMTRTNGNTSGVPELDFESLVNCYYTGLYQFAFSLSYSEADACDLTQQTFYLWAHKGKQLRDRTKVKTWLFTTLYREFLKAQRRQKRFPHFELSEVDTELPTVPAQVVERLDWRTFVHCFEQIEPPYRAPLVLFYLEDYTYAEIAEILTVPIGTVMSRLSRGKQKLHELLSKIAPQNSESAVRRQESGHRAGKGRAAELPTHRGRGGSTIHRGGRSSSA
jgi:RNA polymerase sigma factor (sigma-70 family)